MLSRAVLFSGTIFVIALLGLFLVPTNVLRSLAAGAVIVGVVSVAAALTLLPAILSLLGDRINALRIPFVGTHLGRVRRRRGTPLAVRDSGSSAARVVILAVIGGLMLLARGPGAGPAYRPERRRHPARHAALQAGLPGRRQVLPRPGPRPGFGDRAPGSSHTDHTDLARLQATLATHTALRARDHPGRTPRSRRGPDRPHPGRRGPQPWSPPWTTCAST